MRPPPDQDERVQRRSDIDVPEARERSADELLGSCGVGWGGCARASAANPRSDNGELIAAAPTLAALLFHAEQLLNRLCGCHEDCFWFCIFIVMVMVMVMVMIVDAGKSSLAPDQGVPVRFLDLDVEQQERVQAEPAVLANLVVEGCRAPGGCEEREGDGLAEVVEGESRCADGGEDRGGG